jgi:hypothetical protein
VLQRCRLATRIFLHVLTTGRPPAPRKITVVQNITPNVALQGEPLEPFLHALRIGLRVGWDETLRVSLDSPAAPPELTLPLAGQVFEYIDRLSSRVAEAYALQVEESARTLRHYFATKRSVSKTAARVHRHRQSVIYRLRRAAELLAVDLDDAEAMFRLEAALRTMRKE